MEEIKQLLALLQKIGGTFNLNSKSITKLRPDSINITFRIPAVFGICLTGR